MEKYDITFKKHQKARKTYTWTRFADSLQDAREQAAEALNMEYYGQAVILSVALHQDECECKPDAVTVCPACAATIAAQLEPDEIPFC